MRLFGICQNAARLPLPFPYVFADWIGHYDTFRNKALHALITGNMAKVLAAYGFDQAQIEDAARRYQILLAREVMDAFVMSRLNDINFRCVVEVDTDSEGVFKKARDEGRGTIIVMNHFGRLNLSALALGQMGYKTGMLTISLGEGNVGLGGVDRRYLSMKVNNLRQQTQGRWVTLGSSMRGLYEGLSMGEAIVILPDAFFPDQKNGKVELPFLGGRLSINSGVVRLAEKTGANLVYISALEDKRKVTSKILRLPDDPRSALEHSVAMLEKDVLKMPWLWWHWNIFDQIWLRG